MKFIFSRMITKVFRNVVANDYITIRSAVPVSGRSYSSIPQVRLCLNICVISLMERIRLQYI